MQHCWLLEFKEFSLQGQLLPSQTPQAQSTESGSSLVFSVSDAVAGGSCLLGVVGGSCNQQMTVYNQTRL